MNIENLTVDKIVIESGYIEINWSANIGFGQYIIYGDGDDFSIESECMESPENREFGKMLFAAWLDTIKKCM